MELDHQIRGYKPKKETTKGNAKGNKEKSLEIPLSSFNHNLEARPGDRTRPGDQTRPGDHFSDVLEIFQQSFGQYWENVRVD